MKNQLTLKHIVIAVALGGPLAACAAATGQQSVAEYADDTVVTAKVKTALVDDLGISGERITVATMNNVVQLSGFVESRDTKSKAGAIARSVDGVKAVENDVVVQ